MLHSRGFWQTRGRVTIGVQKYSVIISSLGDVALTNKPYGKK